MDIFSKIKKIEEADYFNQNLSNVLIDEDRDKFTTGLEIIEESDYFNSNLSNVLIDTDRDKFVDSLSLDEESDFFNQNLSNALIEDVDLDSIVDTLSLVETANQQSAVKYYKVEITKTPSTYTTATLSNGRFNGLRFKETTSTFETNAISENVVFTDSNNHDINAVVEYLNGRTESNNNSYNPSAFFVEDASQSWGGTPWNTIEGDSNEDLIYQVIFQSKIQLNDIKTLTFNDINDDNVSVNIKIYESNDLETWELLRDTDISYDSELNEYSFNYENSDTAIKYDDKYKIVLTASESVGDSPSMSDFSFENLIYSECLSPRSATATSENIVFTDSKGNEYNCTISVSSRWYDNGHDDYAPHNVFATADKRVSDYPVIASSNRNSETLTCTINFTDNININLIKNLTAYAGWNVSSYYGRYVKHINCKLYDGKNNLIYENTKDNEENSGNYAMVFLDSIDESKLETYSLSDPTANWKIILTGNPDSASTGNGFSLGSFTDLEYVECLTAQSYSNTSETVVFTDGEDTYNCIVSMNNRFLHYSQDYHAPHNLFAPSDKRECPVSDIFGSYYEHLIVTVQFTDPIAFSKIKSLNFRMGYEQTSGSYYAPSAVQYDLYNDDELVYTTTKLLADADSNRDITITAELPSNYGVVTMGKYGIRLTATASGSYVGLNNFEFDYMDYEGCTDVFPSGTRNVTTNNVQFSYHDDNQDTDVVVNAVASYAGSRWQDDSKDYYDPSYLFKGCQPRKYTYGYGNPPSMGLLAGNDNLLIFDIKFSDEIPLDYIKSFKCKNYDEQNGCQTSNTINFKIYSLNDDLTFNETLYNVDCTKENSYYTVNL